MLIDTLIYPVIVFTWLPKELLLRIGSFIPIDRASIKYATVSKSFYAVLFEASRPIEHIPYLQFELNSLPEKCILGVMTAKIKMQCKISVRSGKKNQFLLFRLDRIERQHLEGAIMQMMRSRATANEKQAIEVVFKSISRTNMIKRQFTMAVLTECISYAKLFPNESRVVFQKLSEIITLRRQYINRVAEDLLIGMSAADLQLVKDILAVYKLQAVQMFLHIANGSKRFAKRNFQERSTLGENLLKCSVQSNDFSAVLLSYFISKENEQCSSKFTEFIETAINWNQIEGIDNLLMTTLLELSQRSNNPNMLEDNALYRMDVNIGYLIALFGKITVLSSFITLQLMQHKFWHKSGESVYEITVQYFITKNESFQTKSEVVRHIIQKFPEFLHHLVKVVCSATESDWMKDWVIPCALSDPDHAEYIQKALLNESHALEYKNLFSK